MAPIICSNCRSENSAGRSFCHSCGRRLAAAADDPPQPNGQPIEAQLADARASLETSRLALAELSDKLSESSRVITTQKHDLDVAKTQIVELSSEDKRMREQLTAGEQVVATLKRDLETARKQTDADQLRLKDSLAESQQMITGLKQQIELISAKFNSDHEQRTVQEDSSIDDLKKKLDSLADFVESRLEQAGAALPKPDLGKVGSLLAAIGGKRKFGMAAMAIASTLFAGAGGTAGWWVTATDPKPPIEAPKTDDSATVGGLEIRLRDSEAKFKEMEATNVELQRALRSQHTAYLRLERDLEDEKSKRPQTPTVASDTLQLQLTTMERQLTEARAATAELEHKYAASNTELEQQRQKIATYEQTIARLNEQVREPREARPQPRPKAKRASDYEFNIKDLREYGKEIVPYIPR